MAIDPGAISGAFALFLTSGEVVLGDLPMVDKQLDAANLTRLVRSSNVGVAVVERVGAMPKQGVASTFKFGFACGLIRGVLAACEVPMVYVAPQVWKKYHGLHGPDKELSRALALRLYPGVLGLERKKDQGRAEALLMGLWYLNKE
jgi:hypothetical protein